MSNPVMERLRRGLTAGAARAEAEAREAEDRLSAAGGVGENELVRIRVDATGRLCEARFSAGISTSTPGGWAAAVRGAYDTACDGTGPLPARPETSRGDIQAVHRPGTSRDGQAERSRELAETLPDLVVEAEHGGVRVSLTGRRLLAGASVTAPALREDSAALEESFTAAWRDAAGQVEARMRAALAGEVDGGNTP